MTMNKAILILPNMRGGCATVGSTVHTLFRVTSRRARPMARPEEQTVRVQRSPDEPTGRADARPMINSAISGTDAATACRCTDAEHYFR
jgi:hypothetical protein